MASMGGFVDIGFIPHEALAASIAMDGDEYVRCNCCGYGGCDVRVSTCGCTLHARCLPLSPSGALIHCPQCHKDTDGLVLFPMSFREIDEAMRNASAVPVKSSHRGRKRKGGDVGLEIGTSSSTFAERRTGRWTNEEMTYCDKLMAKFEVGELPVADGVKLNEFLGNMLKSKQSRLTKKMKNAKLSSKMYQRASGCLDAQEARDFSELEDGFFSSVIDPMERAEIKFHMQKEWREQLSRVCSSIGQPLDADAWLGSVEEMDRRASKIRDAARMTKRKLMMGVALRADTMNLEQGVFIEKTEAEARVVTSEGPGLDDKDVERELLSMLADDKNVGIALDANEQSSLLHSAPFLAKVTSYLQRHNVPFEHVDLWVPSFVPGDSIQANPNDTSCRLCYAGNSTTEKLVAEDEKSSRPLSQDEKFNLYSFGDYSQKFSFNVGCGLPGRVYESGRPTWEQSIHNAPDHHFERCGGAYQWNIKTVVGVPIASPNVGRIVVVLYSSFDRQKDEDLVTRLSEEFTRLMPSPKWKLVVDIGDFEDTTPVTSVASVAASTVDHSEAKQESAASSVQQATAAPPGRSAKDLRIDEVVSLLGRYMPSDPLSPLAPYVSGFMSLRLLLLRPSRSSEEEELVRTMLDSFSSYTSGGREQSDIAVMLARDFLFLSQQQPQNQSFLDSGQNLNHQGGQQAPNASSSSGLSLFGLPSIRSSLENSPALTPIPAPGSIDSLSIVSN